MGFQFVCTLFFGKATSGHNLFPQNPGVGRSITNALSLIIPSRAGIPYMFHIMTHTKWCYLHIMAHCNKQKGFLAPPVPIYPTCLKAKGQGWMYQIHTSVMAGKLCLAETSHFPHAERMSTMIKSKIYNGKRVYKIRIKNRPLSIRFRESIT